MQSPNRKVPLVKLVPRIENGVTIYRRYIFRPGTPEYEREFQAMLDQREANLSKPLTLVPKDPLNADKH
jgi:hypothetical protein